ncbi:acyltransferase family protein [Paenibacillus xanthanilyticus]|uniref:Acyltransferase family protein n=1 Tax=Paenibacillus xanthanilyticus TaxID=1783531 RepID=A0ABV8K024_9BACL
MKKETSRIDSLDSLRGLASFTVIIHHCLLIFPIFLTAFYHEPISNNVVRFLERSPLHTLWAGYQAVVLFFVLSGFVLALPFINNRTTSYGVYAVRRFCRIYLPYIVTVLLSILIFTLFFPTDKPVVEGTSSWFNEQWSTNLTPYHIISFFLMLGYDTHNIATSTWSLVHEMRISLFFPFIMIFVLRTRSWLKTGVIGLIITISLKTAMVVAAKMVNQEELSALVTSFGATFYYTSFFIIGALMAKHRHQLIHYIKQVGVLGKSIVVVLAILFYNIEWITPGLGFMKHNGNLISGNIATLIIDFGTAVGVFLFITLIIGTDTKFMSNPVMLWLGRISYSVYLIHPIILLIVVHAAGHSISLKVLAFTIPVLALAVGTLYYRLVERPSMLIGKRLTTKKKKPDVVETTIFN